MTIPLEALRAVRIVVSHCYPDGSCPDGLSAAMIIKDVLPDASYRFVAHNTREHDEIAAEPGMLFVDITPPPARASEFRDAGTLVLDHHKDKEQLVASFGDRGVFADEKRDRGVSGALLAFEHVWMALMGGAAWLTEKQVRRFATLAGIRDTWQTLDPLWKEACEQAAVLYFFPREDWLGEDSPLDFTRLTIRMREVGPYLIAQQKDAVQKLAANAYSFVTPQGTRVAVLASTRISDAADWLGDAADVVVGFTFQVSAGEVAMRLSFRSRSRGLVDVSAIARSLGGGGHTHAAGASVKLAHPVNYVGSGARDPNPYAMIYDLMEKF